MREEKHWVYTCERGALNLNMCSLTKHVISALINLPEKIQLLFDESLGLPCKLRAFELGRRYMAVAPEPPPIQLNKSKVIWCVRG